MYESLLLNCGGGIISAKKQSEQFKGAAALAIGIGGSGVAALAELKRKVYQQLIPDNPDSPIPTYQHIQFLAIDSDDSDIDNGKGKARLDKSSEFLSIKELSLLTALNAKAPIKKDPRFAWMQIDQFSLSSMPTNPIPVRQVGRYLLVKKAGELYHMLQEKCTTALRGLNAPTLDVYIFAGISGGTGSGCFLDTCYIVRQVLADMGRGSQSKLMGFFFLPDVVTSKPAVASKAETVKYNNSNGYAAMKELDYLMNLKQAADRFRQNYGVFQIDTDEPPVDMCHLLSATKANGSVLPNGFDYCINVAADYVMSYLAEVNLGSAVAGGAGDNGLTMRGHLSNVTTGVSLLPRAYGANLSYHVLGASNAEIPMTQIATYLAAGFYRRFQAHSKDAARTTLTKDAVIKWAQKLKVTEEQITNELGRGTLALSLPDIDHGALKDIGPMARGHLPTPWATPGNAWQDTNTGKHTTNRAAQNGKLSSWKAADATDDSIVGRVFKQLCELCMDPNYGPYYAASLLHHSGFDLISHLTGAIKAAEEKRRSQEIQLTGHLDDLIVQTSTDFCTSNAFNRKSRYADYKNAATQWYLYTDRVDLYDQSAKTLTRARSDLQELYTSFFEPLVKMLDTLNETFEEDLTFLNSPAAKADTGYTWRILELDDVQKSLDTSIANLTVKQLVSDFLQALLDEPDVWLTGDDSKISLYISQHMESVFNAEMNRSLQDYLYEKFPAAGGNIVNLAQEVETHIISHVDRDADAMFWCDPHYDLSANSFRSSTLSVPNAATAICNAASNFKVSHTEYTVRETGLQDRIFALRFFSGVPLYAYQGVVKLKGDYEAAKTADPGIGAHLFANTGRAPCNVREMNWRDFLPTPMSYSYNPDLVPEGPAVMKLYDKAVQEGVIYAEKAQDTGVNADANNHQAEDALAAGGENENAARNIPAFYYYIRRSGDIEIPQYTRMSFMKGAAFQESEHQKARQDLQEKLDNLYSDATRPNWIEMLNDGQVALGNDVVERVRRDYFVHFPLLQKIVRQELDKKRRLEEGIRALDAILDDEKKYSADMDGFCTLLFHHLVNCLNGFGELCRTDEEGYDRLAEISYNYEDDRHASATLVLCDATMPYSKNHPLYQAFLSYRALDPEVKPRSLLEDAIAAQKAAKLKKEDNVDAFLLSSKVDGKALASLQKETSSLPQEESEDIMRFYYAFARQIDEFKKNFTAAQWSDLSSIRGGVTPPAPPAPQMWQAWSGTANLTVYSSNPFYGWDGSTWVPLTPQMQLWDPQSNSWRPMPTDANGQVKLM